MSSPAASPRVNLALSRGPTEAPVSASWIDSLVALGGEVARYADRPEDDRRIVVTLSVPQRDFAAVLVGCGWALNRPVSPLLDPLTMFRELEARTPVRVVTHGEVIADYFTSLDETKSPPRVHLRGSHWQVTGIKAASPFRGILDQPVRAKRPQPGSAGQIARVEFTWDQRLAAPTADLAIVGTLKWLHEDLASYLTSETDVSDAKDVETSRRYQVEGQNAFGIGTIADVLLPAGQKAATWSTRLYASSHVEDHLSLPSDIRAAILDGGGAVKHLMDVEAPVVVCILDRSIADEAAAETVVQLRNSRSEPMSLRDEFGWRPPAGIEALAFTVPL